MKNKKLLLVLGVAVAAYFILNKRKKLKAGVPIIENIEEGFYQNETDIVNETSSTLEPVENITSRINYVGVLPVTYASIAGQKNRKKITGGICSGILK